MHIERFRDHCISKPGVTEEFPFDQNTLVFKVMGKMFALTDVEDFDFINLRCEPELSIELREKYEGIKPGYHMNKKNWNSVYTNGTVSDIKILELIDLSYKLIVESLTKRLKEELNNLE